MHHRVVDVRVVVVAPVNIITRITISLHNTVELEKTTETQRERRGGGDFTFILNIGKYIRRRCHLTHHHSCDSIFGVRVLNV